MGTASDHVTFSTANPFSLIIIISLSTLCQSQVVRYGSIHYCNGINPCGNTVITCDPHKDCQVTCSGQYACLNTIINATTSLSLALQCGYTHLDYASCDLTRIYCPDNGHAGPITCSLYGATSTSIVNGFYVCSTYFEYKINNTISSTNHHTNTHPLSL